MYFTFEEFPVGDTAEEQKLFFFFYFFISVHLPWLGIATVTQLYACLYIDHLGESEESPVGDAVEEQELSFCFSFHLITS